MLTRAFECHTLEVNGSSAHEILLNAFLFNEMVASLSIIPSFLVSALFILLILPYLEVQVYILRSHANAFFSHFSWGTNPYDQQLLS